MKSPKQTFKNDIRKMMDLYAEIAEKYNIKSSKMDTLCIRVREKMNENDEQDEELPSYVNDALQKENVEEIFKLRAAKEEEFMRSQHKKDTKLLRSFGVTLDTNGQIEYT